MRKDVIKEKKVKVNPLKTERDKLMKRLSSIDVSLLKEDKPLMYKAIKKRHDMLTSLGFKALKPCCNQHSLYKKDDTVVKVSKTGLLSWVYLMESGVGKQTFTANSPSIIVGQCYDINDSEAVVKLLYRVLS